MLTLTLALALLPRNDDAKEPPAVLSVDAGGKTVTAELDKAFELDLPGGKTSVKIRLEPYRVFAKAGVSFKYPTKFLFEADLETEGVVIWTLEGSTCVLMVQRFSGRDDPEGVLKDVVNNITGSFGEANVKAGPAALDVGAEKLKGTGLRIQVAGQRINYRFFAFKSGKQAVILSLQDSPGEDGAPSAEAKEVDALLKETLKLPK
jgi:hypothetical protein